MSHPIRLASLALLITALCLSGCATTRSDRQALEGKTVVITGASSGFGRGVAAKLGQRGANVVLAARRTELLEEVAREAGGPALVVTTDVGKPGDIEKLMQAALAKFGRVDVWINDAGVGALGRFEDIPLEDHLRIVDVNIKGVIEGSYVAMREFRRQGSGTLINIGSVAGRVPFPYYSSYVASKHAVVGLGAALNQELRANRVKDIHVVTVNPYAADTPFFQHAANYTGHAPRSVWLDPPDKVVDAIVAATTKPRKEINVGFKARGAVASHRIQQTLTENSVGALIHQAQMEKAAPVPASTTGSLYQPVESGTRVSGGEMKRMEEVEVRNR